MTVHGKVVYLEIPTADEELSAAFYRAVFGWRTRTRGDGVLAFDDATGGVSGAWRQGRPPQSEAGILVYSTCPPSAHPLGGLRPPVAGRVRSAGAAGNPSSRTPGPK